MMETSALLANYLGSLIRITYHEFCKLSEVGSVSYQHPNHIIALIYVETLSEWDYVLGP
jgi:hypothetical protein